MKAHPHPDEENPRLTWMLRYAQRGMLPFPCHAPEPLMKAGCTCGTPGCTQSGKHPWTRHGLYDASNDPAVIAEWVVNHPTCNVAVRTGDVSNFIIIDTDAKHGGLATLGELQQRYGPLPETLTARTGGGGQHLALRVPFPVRNTAGVLGPGVDTRGEGGYAVTSPSKHASGASYYWLDWDMPIASLPESWYGIMPRFIVPDLSEPGEPIPTAVAGRDALYWLDKYLALAAEGSRNDTGFKLALQLRDSGMDYADAASCMEQYVRGVPGTDYTMEEALHSLTQAFRRPARERAEVPRPPLQLHVGGRTTQRRVNKETGEVTEEPLGPEPLVSPLTLSDPTPHIESDIVRHCLHQEEYGDSMLMNQIFDRRLVFDHSASTWYFWTGHSWQEDRTAQIYHLVGGTLAAVYLKTAAELEKKAAALEGQGKKNKEQHDKEKLEQANALRGLADAMTKRAKDLRMHKRMVHVLDNARSFLGITGDEWDQHPTKLAVANGVVDLTTGVLESGVPEDYIKSTAPTPYLGLNHPAPRWCLFLEEMFAGRPAMPGFIQRLCGLSIRGDVPEERLPILYGPQGANGKDKFFGAIAATLGEGIAAAVNEDVLIGKKTRAGAAEPHLMDLRGKRFVWAAETAKDGELNGSRVKLITGGGSIAARQLYGKMVKFAPSHMLWLMTNYLPRGASDDDALWRRLLAVECRERFLPESDLDPDPGRRLLRHQHLRDLHLPEKLAAETSGILAWMVQGHLEWQRIGLNEPEEVVTFTKAYRGAQNDIGQFIDEMCVTEPSASSLCKPLHDAYKAWSGDASISMKVFAQELVKRFGEPTHTKRGALYQGVELCGDPPLNLTHNGISWGNSN